METSDFDQRLSISPLTIQRSLLPLKLVLWGGVICVLDISFTSGACQFDLINDVIGSALITLGVFYLARFRVDERYEVAMLIVRVAAVLSILTAFLSHFRIKNELLSCGFQGTGILWLIAAILFCLSMRWLCLSARLFEAAESWRTTAIWFVGAYVLVAGLTGLFLLVSRDQVARDAAPCLCVPIAVLSLIPLFHFFISVTRMERGIEKLTDLPDEPDKPEEAL